VATPGAAASRSDSLVCSTDFSPTILDLCDLDHYDGIQGRSLGPLLEDPSVSVRDYLLIEDDCAPAWAEFIGTPHKIRTVVTPETRFTRTSTEEELLFDTVTDPDETTNLAVRDPVRRAQAVDVMMQALLDADDFARGAPTTM